MAGRPQPPATRPSSPWRSTPAAAQHRIWGELQEQGAGEEPELRLAFAYLAAGEPQARRLAAFLGAEIDYELFVRSRGRLRKQRFVAGSTQPAAVTLEAINAWTEWLIAAGAEHGAFDGWTPKESRPRSSATVADLSAMCNSKNPRVKSPETIRQVTLRTDGWHPAGGVCTLDGLCAIPFRQGSASPRRPQEEAAQLSSGGAERIASQVGVRWLPAARFLLARQADASGRPRETNPREASRAVRTAGTEAALAKGTA